MYFTFSLTVGHILKADLNNEYFTFDQFCSVGIWDHPMSRNTEGFEEEMSTVKIKKYAALELKVK